MSGTPSGPQPLAAWLGVPLIACLAASLLFALPLRVLGVQAPEPVFAFAPAFAWGIIRPSVLPPLVLLLLGLTLDLLWGAPLGLWPLVLLTAHGGAFAGRRLIAGQGFLAQWAWFGGACALGLAAGLAAMTARAGTPPSLVGLAWQWVACLPLFPFAWRIAERYEIADVRFR